jgi:DNA recombination protein Rad52
MSFTAEQRKALGAKLDARAIRERIHTGHTLQYLEGWYVLAEANRIFGFDGWDRETVSLRCIWEGMRQGRAACAYLAQVRIRVRAGETLICRDGHGSGTGFAMTPAEAHEAAAKEAETDATKRALVTFGNPFGLCLYDKEQKAVRRLRRKQRPSREWVLRSHTGDVIERFADPVRFCSALRRALESSADAGQLSAVWAQHNAGLVALEALPQLRTERGEPYAAILTGLFSKRLEELQQRTDPAVPIGLRPRRVRDKAHLRRVAQQPCVVCGRMPAQAHHLKFLEPRGLGLRPSDSFAIPLCRLHHRALHDHGDEAAWWRQQKIDPVPEADRLWRGDPSAGIPRERPDRPDT